MVIGIGTPVASGPGQRPGPVLFDLDVVLAPDGGLTTRHHPASSLTGAQLADLVRRRGGEGLDVRVLIAIDSQTRPTVHALAHELGRDVLVAPPGCELRPGPPAGSARRPAIVTGDDADPGRDTDVMSVDARTGHVVDWILVQPSGQETAGPGWCELTGGQVRERAGVAALPLPGGGLSLVTRDDFVARRAAATSLRPGHPELVTVAVAVHAGDFVVGDYSGEVSRCDGRQLAAVLARLPLYGRQVRMWLTWPALADERRRLRLNLTRLAQTTGATVWAPVAGSRLTVLEGCRDLASIDLEGRPGRWEEYGGADRPAFHSDMDGRLVPGGGAVTTAYAGVPLVSVPAAHEHSRLAVYDRLRPSHAVFRVDLAVLADGRLALRYRDDSLVAAGQRQLRQLLDIAGWRGEDLMVTSAIPPERVAGARHHAERLAQQLGCRVLLSDDPNPESALDPDEGPLWPLRHPLASAPDRLPVLTEAPEPEPEPEPEPGSPAGAGAAESIAARSDESARLAVLARAVADYARVARELAESDQRGRLALAEAHTGNARLVAALVASPSVRPKGMGAAVDRPESGADQVEAEPPPAVPLPGLSARKGRFIDGPRLTLAARSSTWHGLTWLSSQPQVNEEECELFVSCVGDPGAAVVDGIPSAGLFLLGYLDSDRLASRNPDSHLLTLSVAPGGAVDVLASEGNPPAALVSVLADRDVYLLPAGWLDRCRIVAAHRVTADGTVVPRSRFPDLPVTLLSRGAAHGVPGLPNEVVRWPQGRLHATAARFVLVDAAADGLGRWQRLYRQRPRAVPGHRLLEVVVDRDRAIDVADTARVLHGLAHVRTILPTLVADGVDYVLPVASYPYVQVEREFVADRAGWRRVQSATTGVLRDWRVRRLAAARPG